jgi:exosortase/archaeosortase family protein
VPGSLPLRGLKITSQAQDPARGAGALDRVYTAGERTHDGIMKSLSPTLAFAIKFIGCFAALMVAFEASRGTAIERFLVEDCILKPTVALVHVVAPHEPIQLAGRIISSPSSKLRVTRGCEGVEIFLLLVAGIVAYPASLAAKAQGIAIGFVVSYVLSVSRLIALHFTLRYSPAAWEALHGLILPLGPIVIVTLYFIHWSARNPLRNAVPGASDAT